MYWLLASPSIPDAEVTSARNRLISAPARPTMPSTSMLLYVSPFRRLHFCSSVRMSSMAYPQVVNLHE